MLGAEQARAGHLAAVELSPVAGTCAVKEPFMANEPKRQGPNIPPQKPDILPEPTPQEIPQYKDVPEKEAPPMRSAGQARAGPAPTPQ